jgi:hypothetical protein
MFAEALLFSEHNCNIHESSANGLEGMFANSAGLGGRVKNFHGVSLGLVSVQAKFHVIMAAVMR